MTEEVKSFKSRQEDIVLGLDSARYNQKYNYTLHALSDISNVLTGIDTIQNIDEVLKKLSRAILEATLSDIIIIATDDDAIQEAYVLSKGELKPYGKDIRMNKLPDFVCLNKQYFTAHNFIISKIDKDNFLYHLGFRQNLFAKINIHSKSRKVALCRINHGYFYEDGLFLTSVMGIVSRSIHIAADIKEEDAWHNYITALTVGSWQTLISATEHYINTVYGSGAIKHG